ncbi:RagB/SusD family nutrient uptake outer membrane protein [Neotamlana nanhaiensis]|uniref:RagB/SusD family nutrient uptake outer membrane protein n=1 Tax=Neotamlana nanhaiensis TaxID=1382798 RepID=UPI0009E377B4|nr:RagB/SusD family nutrient uptake outer membrane protein [Tamlana nanhaiensis]
MYFPKTTWTDAEIAAVPYKVINLDTYFTNDGITTVHYPMFTKFDDPSAPFAFTDERAQGTRDMVMSRSGEVYIIAAEAYFMDTNVTDAAARLTALRSRAGLTTPVVPTDVDLDFILDEHARELVGEVNRWMDLKRTSKLVEYELMYNPHAAMNNALTEVNRLRPIPQVEIGNINGTITQSPL